MAKILRGDRFILEKDDESYPDALLHARNPPKRLFGIGDPYSLQEGLAIIGARRATPYGISCAERFAA